MNMKFKFLLVLGLLVLLCLPAGLALADNGPHGNYTATTDACAGCHRAHTAGGARLLLADTITGLCFTCHGSSATGADTNVVYGLYADTPDLVTEIPAEGGTAGSNSLKGGGFVYATMDTDWDGAAGPASVTSDHLVGGQAITTGTLWGNLNPSGPFPMMVAPGYYSSPVSYTGVSNFTLSCISCHDPHGGANGGAATYRILRVRPLNSNASSDIPVTDEANKFYTLSDSCVKSGEQYFAEGYPYPGVGLCDWDYSTLFIPFPNATTFMDLQEAQLSDWCSQCHTRYLMNSTSGATTAGSVDTGDPIFTYRHRTTFSPSACDGPCHEPLVDRPQNRNNVGQIRWGGNWMNHNVGCMSCHVAHGSSATMGTYSGNVAWPGGAAMSSTVTSTLNARSSLLRVDNRGTCQLCHGK